MVDVLVDITSFSQNLRRRRHTWPQQFNLGGASNKKAWLIPENLPDTIKRKVGCDILYASESISMLTTYPARRQ